MLHLLIGTGDKTQRLLEVTKPGFLLIDDGPIADAFLEHFPKARLFDPTVHSFNPLRGIDYKHARDFASIVYTASPEGENTLTVRNGRRALTRLLLSSSRLDQLEGSSPGEVEASETVADILLSPVLQKVLCNPTNFSFKGSIVAKIDRALLGDVDSFILASFLIGQFKGQVIVPDFGFYGRDFYSSLFRQNRLTVGVNQLEELSKPLQQACLAVKDKTIYRTTREDAERLIFYVNPTGNPTTLMTQVAGEYQKGD